MKADIETLADKSEQWLEPWNKGDIDGVLFITGHSLKSVEEGLARIIDVLGDSIAEVHFQKGEDRAIARPDAAGKEQQV